MKLLLLLVCISPAFAQHPDSLPIGRYGEPTVPLTKKTFRHVRLGNQVFDTSQFVWSTFGKVGESEDHVTLFGYQLQWNRATATYIFAVNDTAILYYSNVNDTEDSDAVSELRTPLEKDNFWQHRLTDSLMIGITGADETVTVPLGTFAHCVVTVTKDGEETITTTYAPDIGIIKRATVGPEFSKTAELVAIRKP